MLGNDVFEDPSADTEAVGGAKTQTKQKWKELRMEGIHIQKYKRSKSSRHSVQNPKLQSFPGAVANLLQVTGNPTCP